MSFSGTASASVSFTESALSDAEQAAITIGQSFQALFGDGVTAGNINAVWQDTRTLGTGAADALDMAPTAASGKTGASGVVTFARIKLIYVASLAANTTNLTVSKGAQGVNFLSIAAGLSPLTPGGFVLFVDPSAAGIAVTGAASDIITITNSAGASATYTIIVAGGLT